MYFQSKNKAECCGCEACSHVCGKKAITMQDDGCGFKYPVIDESLCVKCGMCESVCPLANKPIKAEFAARFFALRSKDDAMVRRSSSGGMVGLMAEEVFSRGGVMYGVVYGEGFRVEHARAENMQEAEAFKTSKYVQSDISAMYETLKKDLAEGRTVLVTGTPCQIAGVKNWLAASRTDTSLLYTCDNICHGVSSPLTFSDYLASLTKYIPDGDYIDSVNMRYKDKSGCTRLEISAKETGTIQEIHQYSYHRLYQNRIANRPACFACQFTSYNRQGDITVADFWNHKPTDFAFDTQYGISETLVNSSKGQELFDAIRDKAYYQEVSKEKAWQPHLEYPTQRPEAYDRFWSEYLKTNNREQVMKDYLKVSPVYRMILFVIPILRKTGLYTFCGRLYKKVFVRKK